LSREGQFPTSPLRLGQVAAYDEGRGLGVVTDDDGEQFDFHATAIADGSRSIETGARVSFLVVPGHTGRYEAAALTLI
jgi:cold shock CspA family protein